MNYDNNEDGIPVEEFFERNSRVNEDGYKVVGFNNPEELKREASKHGVPEDEINQLIDSIEQLENTHDAICDGLKELYERGELHDFLEFMEEKSGWNGLFVGFTSGALIGAVIIAVILTI